MGSPPFPFLAPLGIPRVPVDLFLEFLPRDPEDTPSMRLLFQNRNMVPHTVAVQQGIPREALKEPPGILRKSLGNPKEPLEIPKESLAKAVF